MRSFYYLVIVTYLCFCFSVFNLTAQPALSPRLTRQLDSIALQDVPAKAPGIATAIIRDGKLLYEKYGGYADFADSSVIGPATRFNIASNAKQFTAIVILDLIDRRKIALKDDIRKFFPFLFTGINTSLTIEHLLTHTSGIRDVYDLWSLKGLTWWNHSFNNNDALDLLKKQEALNFTPGTQYLYSNSNYILLALLAEKISNTSFSHLTTSLFRKLGMFHTAFEDNYTIIKGPIARAYFNFNTWTTYKWIWNICGDGNLFTTLGDQIRWELILQGKIQTPFKKDLISRSQQLVNTTLTSQYGYGLEFGNYKGLPYTFHEGATGAWKATLMRFPDKKLAIITFTNTGKAIPSMQSRQMADCVLAIGNNTTTFTTQPAETGKYVSEENITGTYLTDNNFSFQFVLLNNMLYLKRSGRNDILLEREANNIFHQKNDPAFKQEFKLNQKGEMTVTAYYTTHAPYTLIRPNVSWEGFDKQKWNGRFSNKETEVELEIQWISEFEYSVKTGSKSYKAILVTPTKLLAGNYTFQMEPDNSILFDADRIKKVVFRQD